MINKKALREYIYNEFIYGQMDEQLFYIVESWKQIEKLNSFQNIVGSDTRKCSKCNHYLDSNLGCGKYKHDTPPYLTPHDKLEIEQLLGCIDFNYDFPIDSGYIAKIIAAVETQEAVNNGQLSFIEYSWPLNIDFAAATELLAEYNKLLESNREEWGVFYDLNEWVKDKITPVEWGFSDEYTLCSECSNTVIRTSPDRYDWTPEYYQNEWMIACRTCAQDYMEDSINETQDRIDHNHEPTSLPHIFDLDDEWVEIDHPEYSWHKWESGLHPGQNDSPLKQGKMVRSIMYNNVPLLQVVFRVYPEQFTIAWQTYVRINPELDHDVIKLDDIIDDLSHRFAGSEGRTKYDLATLYSTALQQKTTGSYNTIMVNSETGEINIHSTNNIEEYIAHKDK